MADTDEDGGFSLLDEDGRLLGLVNIVDLLVVLLVLAVVVAGVALLFSTGDGEPDTRYVTMDLGDQPDFIAEEITVGDQFEPEGTDDTITITDVYRFEGDEGVTVLVRASVNGTTIEPEDPDDRPVFEFRGEPLRIGQSQLIETTDYSVEGEVTQVHRSGETLPTQETEFTMTTNVAASTADEVAAGDEYRVAGERLAEITAVQQFPGPTDGERTLLVGLSAETLDRGGLTLAGTPLRVGNTVPFQTDSYELTGDVVRRSTNTIETEERPFVIDTTVPASVADDITTGDEYRLGGETVVRVESTTFYTTDQPDERRAILGVSAVTRQDDGAVLFGDRQLRLGNSLPVETTEYDIEGEIIRRGDLEEAGERTTVTATLSFEDIHPNQAQAITEGQTERIGEETTVEVLSKTQRSAEIVLESDDGDIFLREHPRNLDVEIDVELSVRELADGSLRFRGDSLRSGDTIPLELGRLRIDGQVSTIED